ncbi:MerR family transcriptional regulator [Nitratireductor luteus]|uniref:MerR family transcriptional regulator n=1 Tax=Nitratireductor luteus TaxID=2976980 RepID=UPI00223F175B|nr:MerR family transcriptional regulator [Nitratireductor luteus]
MTIGVLAEAAGVGVETVRFYERKGLIAQPRKPQRGFRYYAPETVERIRFIRQAQELGFTLRETRELLSLRTAPGADCAAVRAQAQAKLDDVMEKTRRLEAICQALQTLIAACPGKGPTVACTILDAFGSQGSQGAPQQVKVRRKQTKAQPSGSMKTLVLSISGMHCAGCTETVKSLLELEEGVQTAALSLEEAKARILYDSTVTEPGRLVKVVERAGYSASTPAE